MAKKNCNYEFMGLGLNAYGACVRYPNTIDAHDPFYYGFLVTTNSQLGEQQILEKMRDTEAKYQQLFNELSHYIEML